MLEFLIKDNDLWREFEKYGLTEDDLEFIKEQIFGTEDVRMYIQIIQHSNITHNYLVASHLTSLNLGFDGFNCFYLKHHNNKSV